MWLMQSGMLWWSLLALAPIALYFFRHRPRTQRVSTLLFFKALAREHQESAWLRHLKKLLSLLLTLLVILAATLALARWIVAPRSEDQKAVVILIDRSASMAAEGDDGITRLHAAKRVLRRRLAGLASGVPVSVMAYDNRPETLVSRSIDMREVERAIEQVRVRPVAGDTDKVVRRAVALAGRDAPAAIWHATDGPPYQAMFAPRTSEPRVIEAADRPDGADEPVSSDAATPPTDPPLSASGAAGISELDALHRGDVRIEHISVAIDEPFNVGITQFALRKKKLQGDEYEVFVELASTLRPKPGVKDDEQASIDVTLHLYVDGVATTPRTCELKPGRVWRPSSGQMPTVTASKGQVMTLRVEAEGDVLPLDDSVHFRVPRSRPLDVVWISDEQSLAVGLALRELQGLQEQSVQVSHGGSKAWPVKGADVVVFEGWLPDEWPGDAHVVVINPPNELGPVLARRLQGDGLPLDHVRPTNPKHPLMLGIGSDRAKIVQTCVLSPSSALEPLWVGSQGPVLAAGEVGKQRVVVMGFDPMRFVPGESEWFILTRSWPMLMANAVYWAGAPATFDASGLNLSTGQSIRVDGQSMTWLTPRPESTARPEEQVHRIDRPLVELDRVGLWRTDAYDPNNPGQGEAGSAALLSRRETVFPVVDKADATTDVRDSAGWLDWLGGDQSTLLIWLILVVLVVESYLFHRHAVY